jgi:hypothetical protein
MPKLENIFSELNRRRVRYLVAGGVAVNLYGIERATADIDLVVDLERSNLVRFFRSLADLGFKPKLPVPLNDFLEEKNRRMWIEEKHMKVFSLLHSQQPYLVIDFFAEIPFNFEEVYGKRVRLKAGRITIPLVPLEVLIRMKEKSERLQDRADASHLRKIAGDWNAEK